MTPERDLPSTHASAIELDLLEAGALDAERGRRVNEHVEACETCRERQAELRAARNEFTTEVFPKTAPLLRRRSSSAPAPLYQRASVWVPILASAALLVLVFGVLRREREPSDEAPMIQAKGGPGLSLVVRRNGRLLGPNDAPAALRPGDELRFVVLSTNPRAHRLLIASIDGSGRASVYFPFQGERSGAVERMGAWKVPGSVILDATPGPERIFALFSENPIDARTVRKRLSDIGAAGWNGVRTTTRLELPSVEESSVLIEKAGSASP